MIRWVGGWGGGEVNTEGQDEWGGGFSPLQLPTARLLLACCSSTHGH